MYRNVSVVSNNRVVFNVKGNDYRLVAAINYHTLKPEKGIIIHVKSDIAENGRFQDTKHLIKLQTMDALQLDGFLA
ncbi:MAG: type II toxin-antitoxin system HigB family toxin [Proteobacteria bacterium]|nr:type II toxin-antitoxin system HigB family toxin [Pseudomonadota bacterium]